MSAKSTRGVSLFGTRYPTPIVINPVGSQKAFHPDGELAVARAAKARDHLQVLSTVATTSIEDTIAARGGPVWFQLYHQSDWSITKQMVKRVERAGAPAIVFTVDLLGGSNRETMVREARRGHAHLHEVSSRGRTVTWCEWGVLMIATIDANPTSLATTSCRRSWRKAPQRGSSSIALRTAPR